MTLFPERYKLNQAPQRFVKFVSEIGMEPTFSIFWFIVIFIKTSTDSIHASILGIHVTSNQEYEHWSHNFHFWLAQHIFYLKISTRVGYS